MFKLHGMSFPDNSISSLDTLTLIMVQLQLQVHEQITVAQSVKQLSEVRRIFYQTNPKHSTSLD